MHDRPPLDPNPPSNLYSAHSAPADAIPTLRSSPATGWCLVDPGGTVLCADDIWLRNTGLTLQEALGRDILALFPESRDMAQAMHARARAGHRLLVPRHMQAVGGRAAWWEGAIEPVPMPNGMGLLITARQVTPDEPANALASAAYARGDPCF